jgi:SAM-dependent methyltransferase
MTAASRNTLNAHYTDARIAQAVWSAVRALGFGGGRVLEPGCGSGNFIAFAPAGAQLVGVELDPVTAGIAAALHPAAQILPESFADTRDADGSYDLAVGNVPFGRVVPHDRRHNPGGHSIHNHFIIKSLRLVRPGGLVALLTSRYTMDARNPAARREIASLADLVGAVRLPSGAHQRAAGTTVVTDLLILRRREPGREPDARKAAQADSAGAAGPDVPPAVPPVTSLTQRRLAALPPDTRPLPSVAAYDQLLRLPPRASSPSQGDRS